MFFNQKPISLKWHILTSSPLFDKNHPCPEFALKITKIMFPTNRTFEKCPCFEISKIFQSSSLYINFVLLYFMHFVYFLYCWGPHSLTSYYIMLSGRRSIQFKIQLKSIEFSDRSLFDDSFQFDEIQFCAPIHSMYICIYIYIYIYLYIYIDIYTELARKAQLDFPVFHNCFLMHFSL